MVVEWKDAANTGVEPSTEANPWRIANDADTYYRFEASAETPLEGPYVYFLPLNEPHYRGLVTGLRRNDPLEDLVRAFTHTFANPVARVRRRQELSAVAAALAHIETVIQQSRTMLDLPDDWDDAGAVRIRPTTWHRASGFLQSNAMDSWNRRRLRINPPVISPVADGSIDLHWRNDRRQLLINVPADTNDPIEFYGDDRGHTTIKGTVDPSTSTLWLFEWLAK